MKGNLGSKRGGAVYSSVILNQELKNVGWRKGAAPGTMVRAAEPLCDTPAGASSSGTASRQSSVPVDRGKSAQLESRKLRFKPRWVCFFFFSFPNRFVSKQFVGLPVMLDWFCDWVG